MCFPAPPPVFKITFLLTDCVGVGTHHGLGVEVRGHLARVSSLLPPQGFQEPNSGSQISSTCLLNYLTGLPATFFFSSESKGNSLLLSLHSTKAWTQTRGSLGG